ncbi:MAG: tetratricopeptide repeat protein [Planctomycetota bacterium]
MIRAGVWQGIFLLGTILLSSSAKAQDEQLDIAWDQFDSGKFRQARVSFDRVVDDGIELDTESQVAYAQCCFLLGDYDHAAKLLRAGAGTSSDAWAASLLGRVLLEVGQHEEARHVFQQRLEREPSDIQAIWGLARTYSELGQHEQAHEICQRAIAVSKEKILEDPEPLTALAHIYAYLERFERYGNALEASSEALVEALGADADYYPARLLLGDLYVRTYKGVDAKSQFLKALRVSPDLAEAHLGLARAHDYRGNAWEGEREIRRALGINPNCVGALELQAFYRLTDSRMREARELIDRVLEINPRSRESHGLLAAYHFLMGNEEAYQRQLEKTLTIDPSFGGVYYTLGEQLNNRRRFEEAIPYYRKAIEIDPTLWKAYDSLGRNLSQNGAMEEGLDMLLKARGRDNFNYPWRDNMIAVLRKLKTYSMIEDPPFVFYMPVEEKGVLFDYLRELYHEAWNTLCAKYQFEPKGPIAVEMFPSQADFSVRTLGMMGFSALGACFGKLITLVSPRSELRGEFDWVSTSWHEFTHVITLQLSDGRVPRWLTEGLSVYEEFQKNPKWDREMDLELFNAYHNGEIFPIAELNSAFRTSAILFGYYQGGLISDFIEREWGFDRIIEMLKLYAKDQQTPEIFEKVLGIPTDEFDERFLAYVRQKIAPMKLEPVWSEGSMTRFRRVLKDDPANVDAQLGLAAGYLSRGNLVDAEKFVGRALEVDPESARGWLIRGKLALREQSPEKARSFMERGFGLGGEDAFVRLRYAGLLQAAGELDAAVEQLENAKAAFPRYVGPDSPYRLLYQIYSMRGETEKAYAELEALADIAETDMEARQLLAERAFEQKDWQKAQMYLEEILGIDPFLVGPHEMMATVHREQSRFELAIRELEVILSIPENLAMPAIDPEAPAVEEAPLKRTRGELFSELAELYLLTGNEDKAKSYARQALELEGGDERARSVLEQLDR